MVEEIIEYCAKTYRKRSKGCIEFDKLNRHEPVIIDDIEFCCWREYAVYKTAEYIRSKCDCVVHCNLEGNDSNIELEITDEQQKILNVKMNEFLKKI